MMNEEETNALDTILTLPQGTTAAGIASQCREAAAQFINESKRWGKAELSMWLTGSYDPLTRLAANKLAAEGGSTTPWPVPLLREIDARLIDRIMQSARAEILETLTRITKDGSASFVLRALIAGSVMRCEDAVGEPTWAPTGEVNRLADRVLSLFAVDYLARPGDYETELTVCSRCETVSFTGPHACACGEQRHSARASAAATAPQQSILSRRRPTLPYPPLGA